MVFDMAMEDGIVQPIRGRSSPALGPVAVLAATRTDLNDLCRLLDRNPAEGRPLFTSRLHVKDGGPALVGPLVGAPYAAMVLETLIAWGASRFIFVGWCGSISPALAVGDLLVPEAALIDGGTSGHYLSDPVRPGHRITPSARIVDAAGRTLQAGGDAFSTGTVWSTDAIFRETPSQVVRFRDQGAVAVEMEVSALFSVGRFRQVSVGAALVVSDDLSGLTWRPGFRDPTFTQGRRKLCEGIAKLCLTL
jgi:purine-nucleoside phosphorylase